MKIKSNILLICVFSFLACHVSADGKVSKTPKEFEPGTLFTDASCSALKDKVTLKKIKACTSPFYKELALSMYNKQYDNYYRIASYKAYEHPDVQAKQLKTSTYSLLDNPTGISVAEGDTLLVLVADTHNQKLSLRIHNWDVSGKDGFYAKSDYPLESGENKIVTKNPGLIYVMYHTPDFRTVAPVKIHFAKGGKVNGYFDVTRNNREQWKTMINDAVDKHYDVLGYYAHLIFPVANLAKCNGQDLIDFYDRLVYEEQRFMGLEKYGKMRNNRMLFSVMYTSYMYAAGYHTAYNANTMNDLCNVRSLLTSSWGPAHEVGHCNQTRPGLKWIGTAETTNNIQAMYIQRLFGSAARMQMLNKYELSMNTVFRPRIHHHFIKDHFEKLIPFWQLELYMEYILGNTDFYKDIYEHVRTHENKSSEGESLLEFTYLCCKYSGLDLTDFFVKWGFLVPINQEVKEYGAVKMLSITEQQIIDTKKRIAALNLPKPKHCLEYICEGNESLYLKNGVVVKGNAVHEGNAFMMRGWENAVAYEIYDMENNLLFVSPKPFFRVDCELPDTFKMYAIAVDGKRTEVLF